MKPLRAAVVGAGHLGNFHAQKYCRSTATRLAAVVDVIPARAHQIARHSNARVYSDHRRLSGQVDIASVTVPTVHHYNVVRDLLEAGIHVLVEKPFTATLAEGRDLLALSESVNRILQVGHIEQFNAVTRAIRQHIDEPMFIESCRISPFQLRGTDVNVVLDLMIHDIDLIHSLVNAPIRHIHASGGVVLSSQIDIANARIQFENGCVANVTASRVSKKSERSMRIFQANSYLSADFIKQTLALYSKSGTVITDDIDPESILSTSVKISPGDALEAEIDDFVGSVQTGRAPLVSGREGLQALEIAFDIMRQLESNPLPGQRPRLHVAGAGS
ncbi:UDP-N-acetyl-D-glucosamine dehydrogenase [Kineobactrum sediminis]|uniref:UDP-N-acetyl-D-glucosamine dehydrogenase n=1 Tax=Kineobactrum sediminis TaxID=1905677 RepID=A0A2N5Y1J4_9GAMM|nr:Gfo/Idh/MocA family oxidoreductase [Kineobactrum sediminis]PLW82262.1 UDP-N-acetyl-D-glucosamine dehydrogenase [Kineobactrum sediminis]